MRRAVFPRMPRTSWNWPTGAGWLRALGRTWWCWTATCGCRRSSSKEVLSVSRMLDEARAAPEAVARQLQQDGERWRAFGERLRQQPPASLLTIARGSSDHAAHYAAYLVM